MLSTAAIHQGTLLATLRSIFPNENIELNTRKLTQIIDPISGNYFELDIWIPDYNIGFEFQDSYHYEDTWYSHVPLSFVQDKDAAKRVFVRAEGINLVTVPCWWNGSENSLLAAINFQRPDLFSDVFNYNNNSDLIPLNPQEDLFIPKIMPGIEGLMLASFPVQFSDFMKNIAPNEWWIGEKYDGIRLFWNSFDLYTRSGRNLYLPMVTKHLPLAPIDGEAWFGRGRFGHTRMLAEESVSHVQWNSFRFMAFDTPSIATQKLVFEKRYEILVRQLPLSHPFCILAPRSQCQGPIHLKVAVDSVIKNKGEGIIVQKIASLYECGRTPSLLKLKAAQGDKEGMVVAIGKQNKLKLKLPDGTTFVVPPESVHIKGLKIGDIVSFSYSSVSRIGQPSQVAVYRKRDDVTWPEVGKVKQYLYERGFKEKSFSTQPQGHWSVTKNRREFLEKFCKSRSLDPLLPTTWYSTSPKSVYKEKGGSRVLQHYKGGYAQAVSQLFPEIGFDLKTFYSLHEGKRFENIKNRREYFLQYAADNGFDPSIAVNWNPIITGRPNDKIQSILRYYSGDAVKALVHLFPEIGFENHFPKEIAKLNESVFHKFAAENQFDPLVPQNWYSVALYKLFQYKPLQKESLEYKIVPLLMNVFPDIGLDPKQLKTNIEIYKQQVHRHKEVFISFAKQFNCDPFKPDHWYSFNPLILRNHEMTSKIIMDYGSSVISTLLALFPEIGLKRNIHYSYIASFVETRKILKRIAHKNRFDPFQLENWYFIEQKEINSLIVQYGSISNMIKYFLPEINEGEKRVNSTNTREIFVKFAEENGFDPLVASNWYSVNPDLLWQFENTRGVIEHYKSSISRTLNALFPDIGINKMTLKRSLENYRLDIKNQRKLFIDFAHERGFDPFSPQGWYNTPIEILLLRKEIEKVVKLSCYGGSVYKTLKNVFPI